ncbi:MAG: hypothetical protein IJU11_06155 [Prevotella sp.]|nr:hypothetical protein [Prevotella sp.]
MKKQYITPALQAFPLYTTQPLLAGSDLSVTYSVTVGNDEALSRDFDFEDDYEQ